MHFAFHGLADGDFDKWIAAARSGGGALDRTGYLDLERPSTNEPVRRYAAVDRDLYQAILNMCVETGKMCISEMMAIDARGGLGLAGIRNTLPLTYDKFARRGAAFGPQPSYVAGICSTEEALSARTSPSLRAPLSSIPLTGAGLSRPIFAPARPASTSFLFGLHPKSDS
jgi:cytochrome o ubiquinol oxidase subunit 2